MFIDFLTGLASNLETQLLEADTTGESFNVLYTELVSLKGIYNVGYRAYYTNYPGNTI